jgi:DNA-binding CsgD family transcriptional regulator/PAS domain-containing protein
MSLLGLSSRELVQFAEATTTLLAPRRFHRLDDWRRAGRKAVAALIGARRSVSVLPLAGEPVLEGDRAVMRVIATYAARAARTESYAQFARRHGLFDQLSLTVDIGVRGPRMPPAALLFFHAAALPSKTRVRRVAILRLLLPAFRAGVAMCQDASRRNASFLELLESWSDGAAIFDLDGRLLHQNPAFSQMLGSDPESTRLAAAVARTADVLNRETRPRASIPGRDAGSDRHAQQVRTKTAAYVIRGTYLAPDLVGGSDSVLVFVNRLATATLTRQELHGRFHLTEREMDVARLLAEGQSNAALAQNLGISVHTARRHVEHVLTKLGAHSRAAVGALTRSGYESME